MQHRAVTRALDNLVRALGMDGVSQRHVSRCGAKFGDCVCDFPTRPVEGD